MPSSEESNLDSFWKLSDSKDKVRIDAAFKIISHLQRQKNQNQDNFNENIEYDLKRVICGLASDRITARKGYFTSLVQMLKLFPDEASIPKVFELMDKHLSMKGSKSEEADFLCGCMLCLGAILKSEQANSEEVAIACQKLLEISTKRSYLAVASIQLIVDHLPKISDVDFAQHVWPKLSSVCNWKGPGVKIESLWLLLEINSAFPKIPPKSYMQENFKRKKLLSDELPQEIADVLMNGSTNLRIISQGPVFKGIVNALSKSESLLEKFWLEEIVPRVEKSSTFKTSLAFGLLKLIAPVWTKKDSLGMLLPRGLAEVSLKLLSKVESSTEDDLMITSALESLVEQCKGHPQSQNQLLTTLLKVNVSFDKISGSSLVQKLLTNATFESVKLASELYKEALASEGACFTVDQRIFAGQHLAKLVSHPAASNEYEWKIEIICFLLTITQFDVKKVQWPLKTLPQPLSREVKHVLKDTFFRALDTKVKKLEPACNILSKVVIYADEMLKINIPFQSMSADASKAWKEMIKSVQKINAQNGDEVRKEDRVFLMLLIHIGLQLLSSDAETAVELLSDLHVCYDKAKSGKGNKKSSKSSSKTGTGEDEPHWVEVVTDLMLSLLSQNRNVLRQVVNSVTAMLCPYMTQKALMTIMLVINPPAEGDEEIDEDDDDEFEPITEEDLQKLKLEQAEEGGDDDESDEGDDDSDDDDSEEDDDSEDDEDQKTNQNAEPSEELKKKLKDAMMTENDGQEDNSDAESIDIDALDDEAIEKLDTALGQVFRQLSGKKSTAEKKKEKKDALAQVHFKIRALDMVDNYLSHQPPISNVLSLSVPLIKALETSTKDKLLAPLEIRIKGTLRKLTSIKKPEIDDNLTGDALVNLLEALVEMGNSGSPVVTQLNQPIPLLAQLANLIIKCSTQVKSSDDLESRIQQVLIKSMDDFFSNSQCILPPTFFQLPLQGSWLGILPIVPKLIDGGFSHETRPFRRIQALTLLSTLYHNANIRDKIDENLTTDLAKKLMQSLDTFVKGDINLKHKMLCELLHLIFGLHLSGAKCVPWDDMKQILEKVRDKVPKNRNFHEVKRAFNKISAPLKIKVVQGNEKKRKAETEKPEETEIEAGEAADISMMEVNGTADTDAKENGSSQKKDKKKKKKKKHNKERLQKKKEKKQFDLEEQYKNVELPSFKGALVDTINTDDNIEAPKKKKKKLSS